jgi:Mg-chelatase subunit ChlD
MTDSDSSDQGLDQESLESSTQNVFDREEPQWWDGGKKVTVGETFSARRLDTPLDQMMRQKSGRRSYTYSQNKHGRYIRARWANEAPYDLAFDATLRAAAPFQKERSEQRNKIAFAILPKDYMRKVRVRRSANLVLFLVDASWSMAVSERMAATKGAILSLLTDAYQRRDRVGLIVFQKDRAILVLQPTNSIILAERALADIPVGGKTPLSAGLALAYDVLRQEKVYHPDVRPLLIILTDGAGNVSISDLPPLEESNHLAESIALEGIHSVVINMEQPAFDQGLAQILADNLSAPCYTINDIKAENLYLAVRQAKNSLDDIRQARVKI